MVDLEQQARDRIGQLELEIEILKDYLERASQTRDLLAGRSTSVVRPDEATPPPPAAVQPSTEEAPKRTRVTDNPRPSVLIPAVISILKTNGHPMSRRELHSTLKLQGLEVKGTDPVKALGTILWRAQDQVIQIDGRGYWPKGLDYAPAGYQGDPSADQTIGDAPDDKTGERPVDPASLFS